MVAMLTACSGSGNITESGLDPAKFDTTINDKPVKLFVLEKKNKAEVCVTNFGARVVSICVPNKNNQLTDVVLGFDNIHNYADSANTPSEFGAAIGRYANRINKGKVTIAGQEYQLAVNNFGHSLHGGPSGWQYQVYEAKMVDKQTPKLTIVSADGDKGFTGTLRATAT